MDIFRTGSNVKIIHTSDWHFGKSFGPMSLRADQEAFADWFVDLVRSERPDLVVIAGDLFDRAIAPVESIVLFWETIRRLLATGTVIAAITGNHDAPDRVAPFPDLLDNNGLYLRGGYSRAGEVITHVFDDGPLDLILLPFLDPNAAPDSFPGAFDPLVAGSNGEMEPEPQVQVEQGSHGVTDSLIARRRSRTHASVLTDAIAIAMPEMQSPRSIAVAHAFVTGSITSDSERQLAIGGSSEVPAEIFDHFSYTALGHLHRSQSAGGDSIRYSGTPLAYSFSEEGPKSIVSIDMAAGGVCKVETIPVGVGRRVCTIRGTIEELVDPDRFPAAKDQFVRAEITNRDTVLDAKARLADVYPFVVEVQLLPEGAQPVSGAAPVAISHFEPIDVVRNFWEIAEGEPPTEAVEDALTTAVAHAMARANLQPEAGIAQ